MICNDYAISLNDNNVLNGDDNINLNDNDMLVTTT